MIHHYLQRGQSIKELSNLTFAEKLFLEASYEVYQETRQEQIEQLAKETGGANWLSK